MANLRVDKITSTETFETTGSVQFDASSGSGLVVGSSDCDFGTGDFTIEGWFLVQDSAAIRTIFDSRTSDNNSTGLFLGINTLQLSFHDVRQVSYSNLHSSFNFYRV